MTIDATTKALADKLDWLGEGQKEDTVRDDLVRAMLRTGICFSVQNSDLEYRFIANLPDCWSIDPNGLATDESVFGELIAAKLREAKLAVALERHPQTVEINAGDRIFEAFIASAMRPDETIDVFTTIRDCTEERQREKVLRALLREVSHRSKNLLAIIQSIALQTARHSLSLDRFLGKFRGRLYSLAQSQDLVTDSSWRGAYLADLARGQFKKYVQENRKLISITGENVHLSPNHALHIGLALHELVVNSASHGALSRERATIALDCRTTKVDDHLEVELLWREDPAFEAAGEEEASKIERHFGSTVLERIVPVAVGGHAEYKVSGQNVSYRLTFPASEAEIHKGDTADQSAAG